MMVTTGQGLLGHKRDKTNEWRQKGVAEQEAATIKPESKDARDSNNEQYYQKPKKIMCDEQKP